jgi:hypothetical protein
VALEYILEFGADISAEQALRTVLPEAAMVASQRRPGVVEVDLGSLLVVARHRAKNNVPPPLVEEVFESRFPVSVLLRLSKTDASAWPAMIDVVDRFLQTWPDDAVLIFNGDLVVLHRRAGTLRLNRNASWWQRDENRTRITGPFEWAEIPNLA